MKITNKKQETENKTENKKQKTKQKTRNTNKKHKQETENKTENKKKKIKRKTRNTNKKKKNEKQSMLNKENKDKIKTQDNFTYIVQCSDGTYYTGWTNNLERRIQVHNQGKGAKYTRNRTPVKLAYYEKFPTKQEAMSREYYIKKMTRQQKQALIDEWGE